MVAMSEASDAIRGLVYRPEVFICQTAEQARDIILTPEQDLSPAERWERETAYLLGRINLPPGMIVDYGCGIGRLPRMLRQPCIGVDLSPAMRVIAEGFVRRDEFCVASPIAFGCLIKAGLRCEGGLAVWCLQHCLAVDEDVDLLAAAIEPSGILWAVNRVERLVPGSEGADGPIQWIDDGKDVSASLERWFDLRKREKMPIALCAPGAYLEAWQRRPW
jgi:SAM-dependent methyltransferase